MADRSAIEWTDSTFNPWIGCTKVGPGCDHCYAEARMDTRLHRVQWGAGNARSRTSKDYWRQPTHWNREPFAWCAVCDHRGVSSATNNSGQPLCGLCGQVGAPTRRRVFCASLADVFDNEVPFGWRIDLFSLIRATPNLDWLLLTKRIGNAERMIDEAGGWLGIGGEFARRNPLPNLWLGATIVNRAELLRDAAKLKEVHATVRFWSVEPMLGDLGEIPRELMPDWIIAGGESGHHARPAHPDWFRSLRDQCAAAGVPFLFKQWGNWVTEEQSPEDIVLPGTSLLPWALRDEEGLWTGGDQTAVYNVPKKAAGRLLDCAEHNGFPA